MPRDANGYTRLRRWATDRTQGVPHSAERIDEDADDFASALDEIDGELAALDTRVETLEDAGTPTAAALASIVESVGATPPDSPTNGQKYLVVATATGAWATYENKIATYVTATTSWTFSAAPTSGAMVFAKDTRAAWVYDGTAWRKEGPPRETGTAAFDGATAVAVTLTTAFANTSYRVDVEPPSNHTFWITGKTTSGFTVNCSGTISNSVKWSAEAQ